MIGQSIAHYRITAKLGEGGMGEVWRATDTKLQREVALKVLPDSFAQDPDRMARFQREAHVLASLNHPNIAAIYGLENRALVMELVEGQTLRGPLPFETAVQYAHQITDALDAAHEKGITHRDLKPANIMITVEGQVKVLDFGLAKAAERPPAAGDPDNSPTLTLAATRMGVVMGTAGYMAPEQARGQHVDKRADIWAFGVVLFEMLTGKRLFVGETISDTLAAVLKSEIDWSALPRETPPHVRHLLQRCLERDRKKRLRDIADVWGGSNEAASSVRAAPQRRLPWMIAIGVLTAALVLAGVIIWQMGRPIEKQLIQVEGFLSPLTLDTERTTGVVLSPDGTRIAFVTIDADGKRILQTRRMNETKAVALAGTEGAYGPFFSPDGEWIAFGAGGKLKKIRVDGGAPVALCDTITMAGGAWGADGRIIVAPGISSPLSSIPSAGGDPKALTTLGQGEVTHRWPQILPGGKAVLFISNTRRGAYDGAAIEVVTVADGRRKKLHQGASWSRYLPSGHLIYLHKGVLHAMPFDLDRLAPSGDPAPVLDDPAFSTLSGVAQFDFAETGLVVYQRGGAEANNVTVQWLESSGRMQPLLREPGIYLSPRFSPDGKRLALSMTASGNSDIWIYDLARDARTRLTFEPDSEGYPIWTPDGRHIAYRNGPGDGIHWISADGSGKPHPLTKGKGAQSPWSFTRDGKRLVFTEAGDIWTAALSFPAAADGKGESGPPQVGAVEPFLKSPFNEAHAALSPDSKWMAYASDEPGGIEVFVRAFPDTGGKWQISNSGGTMPVWSPNGGELFYRTNDGRLMVAGYRAAGNSFVADKPRLWSEKRFALTGAWPNFAIAPDGKRFAVMMAAGEELAGKRSQVTFLFNFFDELRQRVPAGGGKQ